MQERLLSPEAEAMRSLSNNIYKNYQVNLGIPFQVKGPINFQTIKTVQPIESFDHEETQAKVEVDIEEIINKAKEEAEMIIKEANYEATRILENTEAEANENKIVIEEESRQKGYNEGYAEAKQQYEDLLQEAECIKENSKVEYKEFLAGIESDAVELILDIAKNVIGAEISFHKDDILYLVKEAFDKCGTKESVILKAAPEDYEFIIANKDKLLSMVEGIGELKIKKDSSLKVGACIVETPYGSIDAGIQTKVRKIGEAFRQVIGK